MNYIIDIVLIAVAISLFLVGVVAVLCFVIVNCCYSISFV